MRVAYALERYPELSQTFVEDELRALAGMATVTDVLALQPGEGAELADARFRARYPPPPARRLAGLALLGIRHPVRSARLPVQPPSWPRDGTWARGVARIAEWALRAGKADHLHSHFATEGADVAALLARLSGRTHSFTAHATDLYLDPVAVRERVSAAPLVVLISEYARRQVERLAPQARRLEVVQLGLPLDRLRRRSPYAAGGPVVAVGRLVEFKGLADLAAVARELPSEVVIAGDGPLRSELEALAQGAVRFSGALPRAEVLALIERAALLVVPSVVARDGSRDGIPTVLLEALALGVPVVASDAVGNPEVVRPDFGALYPPGDRTALREAVEAILRRPAEEREAMGRAGRAFAEQFADVRRQTARLLELMAETATARDV